MCAGAEEVLGVVKKLALFGLVVSLAVLAFSPVVQSGQEVHILFDFDLLLLIFTGESDPTVLTTRHVDWYPNVGVLRIIVSVGLAGIGVYMCWKVEDPDPVLGTTEAGRRARRVVDGGALEVVDDLADGAAPAAGAEARPALLLPDHSRSPASPAEGGDAGRIGYEPSDHLARRGASRLNEAK